MTLVERLRQIIDTSDSLLMDNELEDIRQAADLIEHADKVTRACECVIGIGGSAQERDDLCQKYWKLRGK